MKRWTFYLMILVMFFVVPSSFAADYEVSTEAELADALTQVVDGETIVLTDGDFGELLIRNRDNRTGITLEAKAGHTPVLGKLDIRDSDRWTFRGLTIERRIDNQPYDKAVNFDRACNHITFEDGIVNFADDITGWTVQDWYDHTAAGFNADGNYVTIRNTAVYNVDMGINAMGDNALISNNTIYNIRGDGMRLLGDNSVAEYNVIKNFYVQDRNHDDGIQIWSRGENGTPGTGVVLNTVLRGNTILNYEDPNQPLYSPAQGIALFDGMYDGAIIENNLVVVDHWHGISVYGVYNSTIINNTVIDINTVTPGYPWIRINPAKNGTPSVNNVVQNNLTTDLALAEGSATAINNIVYAYEDRDMYFVDADGRDYRLNPTSPAIDAGENANSPQVDIMGTERILNGTVDVGAFEHEHENMCVSNWQTSSIGEFSMINAKWQALLIEASQNAVAWRQQEQQATWATIEAEVDAQLAALRAQMIQDLMMSSPRK